MVITIFELNLFNWGINDYQSFFVYGQL